MPVDKKLLEILCCPVTKVPVKKLPKNKLQQLNEQIAQGHVRYVDGSLVDSPLEDALITETGTTIYRVDSSIPVMLEDKGIITDQLQGF
ncbi:MAG: Trm112 family protein [Gammaproteobacteria bacterium]|nr:Trm112 family protein [Gammaproteobacteria bacterium]MCI0591790.1 Trm112 family protein [Gammaproteobacteria bacterium]